MKSFVRVVLAGVLPLMTLASMAQADTRIESIDDTIYFDLPSGWTQTALPGKRGKAATGPATKGFRPNINVVSESTNLSLDEYTGNSLDELERNIREFKLVKREKFKTRDGTSGRKVIVETEFNNTRLRQTFYIFENGGRKYVATCTAPADGGDKLDSVFETSMKSFRFIKK